MIRNEFAITRVAAALILAGVIGGCDNDESPDVYEELKLSIESAQGMMQQHESMQNQQQDPAAYAAEDAAYVAGMKQHMSSMNGMMNTMMNCNSGSQWAGQTQSMMGDVDMMNDELDRHMGAVAGAQTMAQLHMEETAHFDAMGELFNHMGSTNTNMMMTSGMPMCQMGGGMMGNGNMGNGMMGG